VVHHDEVFKHWFDWIEAKSCSVPFRVVHADAHADLGSDPWGCKDRDWSYLLTEFLLIPDHERSKAALRDPVLDEGNYLAFAVCCGWIDDLTLVYPSECSGAAKMLGMDEAFPVDLIPEFFADRDTDADHMSISRYISEDRGRLEQGECVIGLDPIWSPCFQRRWSNQYVGKGFTHMALAKSPDFTPLEADELIPVILEYVDLI
jgi:hypothetical protein